MRFWRAGLAMSIAIAAFIAACNSFSGGPSAPAVDAGADATTTVTEAGIADATSFDPNDAGSGPLLFETHGDPSMNVLESAPVDLTPSGGTTVVFGLGGPSTVFGRQFPINGFGFATLDSANVVQQAKVSPQLLNELSSGAVDGNGDLYLTGQRVVFGPPLVPGGPSTIAGHIATVVKLDGTTGLEKWHWDTQTDTDPDAGTGRNSFAIGLATRGTDVVITILFDGRISHPSAATNPAGGRVFVSAESGSPVGVWDSLVLFLDGRTGNAIWTKQISGSNTTQYAYTADFDGDGNVLVSGFAAGLAMTVDGTTVIPALPTYAVTPFFLRFAATQPHDVTLGRFVPMEPTTANAMSFGVRALPNGEFAACGRIAQTTSFDGHPISIVDGQDGWLARFDADGGTQWVQTWGGAGDDDCADLAVDANGHISASVNYQSSNVKLDGVALPDSPTNQSASAIAKFLPNGKVQWVYPIGGASSRIGHVAVAPNGDTLYTGAFLGTADLGDGPVETSDAAGGHETLFLVRRGP